MAGVDDAGLLHLTAAMPQLLHLDVCACRRVTAGGLAQARAALVEARGTMPAAVALLVKGAASRAAAIKLDVRPWCLDNCKI